MSFAVGSSEAHHQLWFLIPSQQAPAAAQPHHPFAMDDHRRPARRRGGDPHPHPHPHPHRRGAMHGAVAVEQQQQQQQQQQQKQQHRGRPHGTRAPVPPPPGYFTAELVLAFLFVAVSLAFLPLVLPPLSPPPFLLLLVPVGLLAVLLALAFVPLDAHSHLVGVGSSPRLIPSPSVRGGGGEDD